MPVAGYNVVPDENDHEPIISIDIEEVNELSKGKACVCIGEGYGQTEIHLNRDELQALIAQATATLKEMDGAQDDAEQGQQEEADAIQQNLEFALYHLQNSRPPKRGISAAVQDALNGWTDLKNLLSKENKRLRGTLEYILDELESIADSHHNDMSPTPKRRVDDLITLIKETTELRG